MPDKPAVASRRDREAEGESRHDTGEMPVTKAVMRSALRVNEVWTVIVAIVTAGAALLTCYALFISKAEAAGQEAAKKVAERQDQLEESQKEVKLDMRDLYKAVMYGKRSERLERPPVDPPAAKDGGP